MIFISKPDLRNISQNKASEISKVILGKISCNRDFFHIGGKTIKPDLNDSFFRSK